MLDSEPLFMNPFCRERHRNTQQIIDFIDRNPGRYESRVVALYALKLAHTKRTIKDYVNILLEAEIIEKHDRRLYIKGKNIIDPRPLLPEKSHSRE